MGARVDLQPTLLEAVGLGPTKSDGYSFLPLLRGERQEGRDAVFAQFYHIHGKDALPMRSVITRDAAYVFNPWSNGERPFTRLGGPAFAAMVNAAKQDPVMAERIKYLRLRRVEEFFDLSKDPNCLENLIGSGDHKAQVEALRAKLRKWMAETADPALAAFDNREQPEALDQFVEGYRSAAQKVKDALRSYEKRKGYRF